jgi:hypothetical protein
MKGKVVQLYNVHGDRVGRDDVGQGKLIDQRHTGRLKKRDSFVTGEEEGVVEEPNHTTARKPGPL